VSLEKDRSPAAGDCGQAGARLAAFLAGELSRAEQERLRGHLAGCPACRQRFEEAMSLAAHLNREPRRVRDLAARLERRRAQRSRALSGAMRLPGGDRGARLRLLVLPALAIFLFTGLARGPREASTAVLEPMAGAVFLGKEQLGSTDRTWDVVPGQQCSTGDEGRARLGLGPSFVELGPRTRLWLEDVDAARIRLGTGSLRVGGSATLTSRAGVVEVREGLATVRLGPEGLTVVALEGEAVVADSHGERRALPGAPCLPRGASRPSGAPGEPVPASLAGG
jgi:hypothetical protein